jgi:serine/threonine-protein kinase
MPAPLSDRNLLFGILALQLDFIDRNALVAAMHAWGLEKHRSLGELLQERGRLAADCRQLLDALVAEHLRAHGDDAQQSLAALSSTGSAQEALAGVSDSELQASLRRAGGSAEPAGVQPPTEPEGADAALARRRFRVLRAHARGGLGEVFVARDEELNREVALKEIRADYAGDTASRERFRREAEVTGRLEHPGIVLVYGLGTYGDGRPFYAMRFVKGDNLMEAITRFHAGGGRLADHSVPSRDLLSRFIDVCQAVAYAHARGVLHRDLKPGNILLGPFGETLVVDWGLAKPVGRAAAGAPDDDEPTLRPLSGDLAATAAGQAVGTPAYMSPEQAAGRHDALGPRSDVYSLGATLFALLTGRAPLAGKDPEALRKVERGDRPRPRQVRPDVPRPLEAVCLRAMARQPEDRYASALDLAADVERWLADEPVAAYRDPWAVRATRWARRHRAAVGGLAALLLTALASLAVGLWAVNRERLNTERAHQAEADARRRTRAALNTLTDEAVQRLMARQPILTRSDRDFLRKVLEQYEGLATSEGDTPDGRAALADGHYRVARIRMYLGETEGAKEAFRTARDLLQRLVAEFPDNPGYRHQLAKTLHDLGSRLIATPRAAEGEEPLRAALSLLEGLVEAAPEASEYRAEQGTALYNLGVLLSTRGEMKAAEEAQNAALAALAAVPPGPDPTPRRTLGAAQLALGDLYRQTSRPDKQAEALRAAVATSRRLADDFPDSRVFRSQAAVARLHLGTALMGAHRGQQAEAELRGARDELLALVNEYSAVPEYRVELARAHNNLGVLLRDTGRSDPAEEEFRAAYFLWRKLADDDRQSTFYRRTLATSLGNLGSVQRRAGRKPEAAESFREAIALSRKLAEQQPNLPELRHELALNLDDLASVLPASERGTILREVRDIEQKLVAEFPNNSEYRNYLAWSFLREGGSHRDAGQRAEAEAAYREARRHYEQVVADMPRVVAYRLGLAATLQQLGAVLSADDKRAAEAEELLQTARTICTDVLHDAPQLADASSWLAASLASLASLKIAKKDFAAARDLAAQAVARNADALRTSPRHPQYRKHQRSALLVKAQAPLGLGDHAAAAATAEELVALGYAPPIDAFEAACALARASVLAGKDSALPEAKRGELGRSYADRAMGRLRDAVRLGLRDAGRFKHPDLDPLRGREDFKSLLADLATPPERLPPPDVH